jgi:hypothetical protein
MSLELNIWHRNWRYPMQKNDLTSFVLSSVANPDQFDADPDPDPDPTSEKNRIRIRILLYIKFCNKKFLLKNGL